MAWDDINNISWLNVPTVTDAFAKASQASESIGRNFLSGFRSGMEKREQDVLLPLRQQQAQFQLAKMGLEIAGEQIVQSNEVDTTAGLITLGGKLAEIKDWSSPAAPAAIWETVRDNPKLALTKPGQAALAQAEAMHAVASNMDTRIKASETAAQARIDAINAAAAARSVDLENRLKSTERIADDRNKTILEKEDRANKAEMETTILQLEKAGFNLTDHAKLAALKGEITAINQDPTMAADPNKKRVAIQNAAAKYTASSSAPRASASAPPAQSGPSRPKTKVEYDALPVGAEFIDPGDGKTYRKTK